MNLPNFTRRRKMAEAVEFVPVQHVFKPHFAVTMTQDVSGWVNKDKLTRKKWSLSAGQTYFVDEQTAVEFLVKGYATGEYPRPVSDDERAQYLSQVTTISLGLNGSPPAVS